jgi:L-lactate dehydrogenase complex protein LldE
LFAKKVRREERRALPRPAAALYHSIMQQLIPATRPIGQTVPSRPTDHPKVGLFVTCLVDLMRPSIGFAAAHLLEQAGCVVDVPRAQTCCGQPAWNSGDRLTTAAIARRTIEAFEGFDYIVAPSGSCGGMIKRHYVEALAGDTVWEGRAKRLAQRTYELISFLVDVRGMTSVDVSWPATATYHDSCSGLRELGIRQQPRSLLATVRDLTMIDLPDADSCCGFGGTFSVKYPDISNKIVEAKSAAITSTKADLLIAGDLGCLMNMAGKLSREGSRIAVRHVAEVLAGMHDLPPIGKTAAELTR